MVPGFLVSTWKILTMLTFVLQEKEDLCQDTCSCFKAHVYIYEGYIFPFNVPINCFTSATFSLLFQGGSPSKHLNIAIMVPLSSLAQVRCFLFFCFCFCNHSLDEIGLSCFIMLVNVLGIFLKESLKYSAHNGTY